jgi:hypothetical protein
MMGVGTSTPLRDGPVQVAVCHGRTPHELEQAINASLERAARQSRDPQLLDIKFPQLMPSSDGLASTEYLALVVWQQ